MKNYIKRTLSSRITAKHGSGSATLTIRWDPDALIITVTNPVPALVPQQNQPSTGHGLIGMHERAVTNGGALEAGPTPVGFTVAARLPLDPHAGQARS